MKVRCLARAYADKPLDRFAVGVGKGLIYIVSPELRGTDQEVAGWSVGFPVNAIYEFDEGVYENILAAFKADDRQRVGALWKKARPLTAALPDIDDVVDAG
jgi:hypothetical protein